MDRGSGDRGTGRSNAIGRFFRVRCEIFESRSHHIEIGLAVLPTIARRLNPCLDLTSCEPFDFPTFFDSAERDEAAFDQKLAKLRTSEEWRFVEREIDIRLVR
jgi:hypothetical protein